MLRLHFIGSVDKISRAVLQAVKNRSKTGFKKNKTKQTNKNNNC